MPSSEGSEVGDRVGHAAGVVRIIGPRARPPSTSRTPARHAGVDGSRRARGPTRRRRRPGPSRPGSRSSWSRACRSPRARRARARARRGGGAGRRQRGDATEHSPASRTGRPSASASSTWPPASSRQPRPSRRSSSQPRVARPRRPPISAARRGAARRAARLGLPGARSEVRHSSRRVSTAFPLRLPLLEERGHALAMSSVDERQRELPVQVLERLQERHVLLAVHRVLAEPHDHRRLRRRAAPPSRRRRPGTHRRGTTLFTMPELAAPPARECARRAAASRSSSCAARCGRSAP